MNDPAPSSADDPGRLDMVAPGDEASAFGDTDAIGKAFAVLRCFIDGQEEWGARELATALGQPASSVHRLLKTLRREGFLQFDPVLRRYRLGLELLRVSAVALRRPGVHAVAAPVIRQLAERTGETVSLALLEAERGRIVYVQEYGSPRSADVDPALGRSAAVAADIAGVAILAASAAAGAAPHLETIRQRRYASEIVEEGRRERTARLAAVIRDHAGAAIGALVLAMTESRLRAATELRLATDLVAAANEVSSRLGARILGGASSGSWRDGLEALTTLIGDRIPGLATVPSLGGGVSNLVELEEGRAAYCITTATTIHAAYEGRPPFATAMRRLRIATRLSTVTLHAVASRRVRFGSLREAAGLRISSGLPGFASQRLLRDLLRMAGVSARRMQEAGGQIAEFEFAEAARQLLLGNVDLIMGLLDSEAPSFRAVLQDYPEAAYPIQLDPALIDQLIDSNPGYRPAIIPAGTYPEQQADIRTLSVDTVLATSEARDEEEVLALVRLLAERRDELRRSSSAYSGLLAIAEGRDLPVPLHPGAARFWKEGRWPIGRSAG
ncbi:TAXI family TRAP transporter solute-binding subunit [Roseomonas sp. HJA6]|uniref:TAXI family TRAP transporter solute-binding subunit n=1 Tax=Roseomonas alba TaxID=2846776 RepID=A0ABS7AAM7_9PROT|nr:TAXI family TRAP transporter solute-binding subunit [Neoroseomonas alba]MBW6399337.1 TAXI family TRAP transporter solute-binding subunit [Neoroseomonas alba]